MGVSLSAGADRYENDGDWIQFTTLFTSVSAIFHTKSQYDGLFIRTDLGSSKLNFQDDSNANDNSESGLGYLVGLGYSFPLSSEARIVPYVNYFGTTIESEKYSKISFGVSIVF